MKKLYYNNLFWNAQFTFDDKYRFKGSAVSSKYQDCVFSLVRPDMKFCTTFLQAKIRKLPAYAKILVFHVKNVVSFVVWTFVCSIESNEDYRTEYRAKLKIAIGL